MKNNGRKKIGSPRDLVYGERTNRRIYLKMFRFAVSFAVAISCLVGLAVAAVALLLLTTPRPTDLRGCLTTSMFHVRLCPRDASYVKLREISPFMRSAVIVSEDGSFYSHKGIDWFEMRQSFERNLERGGFIRGGSTITQQLAKNVYLSAEKSLLRKVREAIIAVQIEDLLSKDEILEKYLNVVEFGPKLYGVKNAARHYFGKAPSDLTVAESAFLAFLLPNPQHYSVSFKRKQLSRFARSQMKIIIERLHRFHKIDEESYQQGLYQLANFFGVQAPPETGEPGDGEILPSAEELGEPSEEIPPIDDPLPLEEPEDDLSTEL